MAKTTSKAKAPAKKAAAPAKSDKVVLPKKGDQIKFKGYSEDIDEPMFEPGDILTVESATLDKKSGDIKCTVYLPVEGKPAKDIDKDTIYLPDEGEIHVADEKKAPAKSKAKAVAVEEDEDETEDEEEIDEDSETDDEDEGEEEAEEDDSETEADEDDEEEEAPAKSKSKAKSKAVTKAPAKADKKKAPARTKDEAEDEEIEHSASVKKILKKSDMLAAAKEIVDNASRSYFNLGGVLAEIKRTSAYEAHDFTGKDAFEDYIRQELGLEYRKAMKLITIYKVFSKLGIDETRVMAIGWTKASAIASYMPKDAEIEDFEAMLDEADELTREDLIDHIKTTYVNAGKSERVKRMKFTFSAFEDQGAVVMQAIESAKKLLGSEDMNEALLHIIQEWATMADGVDIDLKDAIKVIEKRFGVKLKTENASTEKEKKMAVPTSVKTSKATVKKAAVKSKAPTKTPAKAKEKMPAKVATKTKTPKQGKVPSKQLKSKK